MKDYPGLATSRLCGSTWLVVTAMLFSCGSGPITVTGSTIK
jgi:hypothetical protein